MGKSAKFKKKNNNNKKQTPAFTKIKKKVGKKQTPTNATRVDFKSRQIHFPSQLISSQDSSARLSSHLTQLTHHNANTRVHAISSLFQLASKEHELVRKSLANLLYKLEPLFTDTCVDIQKQLQAFLALLFKLFPSEDFKPYISLLVAYLVASLTHPDSTVQYTALNISRNFVEAFPREISHHLYTILPKYLSLLTGTYLHNNTTQKYPTFSQLVAPRVSTRILAVSNTTDHVTLIFENIKQMSSLLIPQTENKSIPNTTQNNKHTLYIAPRLIKTADKSIQLHNNILLFFTAYLSVSWSHAKELHTSLSQTYLSTKNSEHVIRKFSAIIDTYMLIPKFITPDVLQGMEATLLEEYSTQEASWVVEFYKFFSVHFPIEAANSALLDSLHTVNYRVLYLYISVHMFVNPDIPFDKNKAIEFIENLTLNSDDVTFLVSKLKILKFCKQSDATCGCSHLISLICRIIWDYLQQNDNKHKMLNFVVFILGLYLGISNDELLQSLDSIIKHLPSLVQNEIPEDTSCEMVDYLSHMFRYCCVPLSISLSRSLILLSLLKSLSKYSSLLQNKIINLAFFADTDDSEFLCSLGSEVLTNLPTDKSISLLDVLFHSFQTHNSSSDNFTIFLTNLSTNTPHSRHSQLDIDTPLALRAACYLTQISLSTSTQSNDS